MYSGLLSFSKIPYAIDMGNKKQRKIFAGFDLGKRSGRTSSLSDGLNRWLTSKGMDPRQTLLSELWRNWETVMGPLSDIAHPLGHRNDILLIGADDPCTMQELTYAVPELLERANAFMDLPFFNRVELHLLMGKNTLRRVDITEPPVLPSPPRPPHLGNLQFPEDSPLAECYKAYLRLFKEK